MALDLQQNQTDNNIPDEVGFKDVNWSEVFDAYIPGETINDLVAIDSSRTRLHDDRIGFHEEKFTVAISCPYIVKGIVRQKLDEIGIYIEPKSSTINNLSSLNSNVIRPALVYSWNVDELDKMPTIGINNVLGGKNIATEKIPKILITDKHNSEKLIMEELYHNALKIADILMPSSNISNKLKVYNNVVHLGMRMVNIATSKILNKRVSVSAPIRRTADRTAQRQLLEFLYEEQMRQYGNLDNSRLRLSTNEIVVPKIVKERKKHVSTDVIVPSPAKNIEPKIYLNYLANKLTQANWPADTIINISHPIKRDFTYICEVKIIVNGNCFYIKYANAIENSAIYRALNKCLLNVEQAGLLPDGLRSILNN